MVKLRLLAIIGALICLMVACSATMYMVGDTSGWDISSDLDSWESDKRFVVGDVLMFQYSSSGDSVCQLTKEQYLKCDTTNAVLKSSSGNTTFALTKPGEIYFASCNKLYCLGGMKLQVHVESNSTATPVAAPIAAPGPTALLPGTSKNNNNPVLPSSAELNQVGWPMFLLLLGFLSYSALVGVI